MHARPCIPLAVYCVKLVVCDRRVANKRRKELDKALHKSHNTTPLKKLRGARFSDLKGLSPFSGPSRDISRAKKWLNAQFCLHKIYNAADSPLFSLLRCLEVIDRTYAADDLCGRLVNPLKININVAEIYGIHTATDIHTDH